MTRFNLSVNGQLVATEVGRDQLASMVVAVADKHGGPVEVQPVRDTLRQRQRGPAHQPSTEAACTCWADQLS